MKRFDISACSIAIATAMVTNIRTSDDHARFKMLAEREGMDSVSDWIAKNSVNQSIALATQLEIAEREMPSLFEIEKPFLSPNLGEAVDLGKSVESAKPDQHLKDIPSHAENVSAPNGKGLTTTFGEVDTLSATDAGGYAHTPTNQGTGAHVASGESPEVLTDFEPDAKAVFGVPPSPNAEEVATPLVPAASAAEVADTTSTTSTTGTATNAELDSEGLPWDGRIHSSSKKKLVENGRWKLIRGVDKDLVETVKSELRAALSAPTPAPVENTQGLHPTPNPLSPKAADLVAAQMGNTVPAAISWTPAAVGASSQISNFAQLMSAITANGLKPEFINPVIQSLGIPSMPVLATRQDLIPSVAAALGL